MSQLFNEILERGYSARLFGSPGRKYEAHVMRPLLEPIPKGYVQAVGYGVGYSPDAALDMALDRCENDFERIATYWQQSTHSEPEFDIRSILPPVERVVKRRF